MRRCVTLDSIEFARTAILCPTGDGNFFTRHVRVGMPKIPHQVIRCIFYLYETVEDAKHDRDPGGTGFFLIHREKIMPSRRVVDHTYAVTNWHVAKDRSDPKSPPCPVIKYRDTDGRDHTIPLRAEDWYSLDGHSDLAVVPLADERTHTIIGIPSHMLIDEKAGRGALVNVGDDVFMMGLFINPDDAMQMAPAARFGNISVIPDPTTLIDQPNAGRAEAYILDVHSRSGFSGSPVFVYRTFGSDLSFDPDRDLHMTVEFDPRKRQQDVYMNIREETVFGLLAVHFAQFSEEWEIGERQSRKSRKRRKLVDEGRYVAGFSGMTLAVPAWRLMDLINVPELVALRSETIAQAKNDFRGRPIPERTRKSSRQEQLSEQEIVQRRDDAVRRALQTPPKPQKDMVGKNTKK